MTKAAWIFLKVGRDVELALDCSLVHRVLHAGHPDFRAYASEAVDLALFLNVIKKKAPSLIKHHPHWCATIFSGVHI